MRNRLLIKRFVNQIKIGNGIIFVVLISLISVILAIKFDVLTIVFFISIALFLGLFILSRILRTPGNLLVIYLLALPIYTISLSILYNYTGSQPFIKTIQPWKEVLAFLVLFIIVISILLKLKLKSFILLDYLIFLFLGLNVLYLIVPWGLDDLVRFYGIRANAFFTIIYLLGRFVPLSGRQQKIIFSLLVGIGALAGIVVIVEIVALPVDWPARIGLMKYLNAFFGIEPIGHYGLTWTFETSTAIRRYSAFFANPLELASSTLITGAAAFYAVFSYKPNTLGRLVSIASFVLIIISLLLAISRASLAAFIVLLPVMCIWLRKIRLALLFIIISVIGLVILLVFADPGLIEFTWETITFQNTSSQGHLDGWKHGVDSILASPFGIGLGTSGHIGSRFGTQVGGENQFIIIGVELGILGLILYISILSASIFYSLKAFQLTEGVTRGLCFVAAASKFGLLIPSFTSHIEVYIFAMFISWWLVGFSIQQLQIPSFMDKIIPSSKDIIFENSN